MAKTATTNRSNGKVRELVDFQDETGISLKVENTVNGDELERVLSGVTAFSKAFPVDHLYKVTVNLQKVEEKEIEVKKTEAKK